MSGVIELTLDEHLRKADGDLASVGPRFQKVVAGVVQPAWLLATGADYEWPETTGSGRSLLTRISHCYSDKLLATTHFDHTEHETFLDANQLKPPTALFAPVSCGACCSTTYAGR